MSTISNQAITAPAVPDRVQQYRTIYLNDHLAAAAAGLALFRRAGRNQHDTERGEAIRTLAERIEQDREALLARMHELQVPIRHYKQVLMRAGELVSRLKLNGRILRRSPLSSLVELESMLLAVTGKRGGWLVLRELARTEPRLDEGTLDELLERAQVQIHQLEELRLSAAQHALRAPGFEAARTETSTT